MRKNAMQIGSFWSIVLVSSVGCFSGCALAVLVVIGVPVSRNLRLDGAKIAVVFARLSIFHLLFSAIGIVLGILIATPMILPLHRGAYITLGLVVNATLSFLVCARYLRRFVRLPMSMQERLF
jgi:uncharacterized protein YacL